MKLVFFLIIGLIFADKTLFEYFYKAHARTYTGEQKMKRYQIFTDNLKRIKDLNEESFPKAHFGINEFADVTPEEFRANMACYKPTHKGQKMYGEHTFNTVGYSDVDWRTKGGVNSVKNQGMCGSCWAFSAVACMEGAHFVSSGTLESLSEQQLVDCDKKDSGCNGGWMDNAFDYAIEKGMESEKDYPYYGRDMTCHYDESKVVAKFSKYEDIKSEEDIGTMLVNQGPVSIAVDAGVLQFYSGGVISGTHCKGRSLDHGVIIIGYESLDNAFIVRNSWGSSWGEKGYFKAEAGIGCLGLAEDPSIIYSA